MKKNKKLSELRNFRKINARYIGPTDTRVSRICLEEKKRYNDQSTKRKYFSYCYKTGDVQKQAFDILTNNGFNIEGTTSDIDSYGFLCDNWGEDFKKIESLK